MKKIFPKTFIKELKELLESFGLGTDGWSIHGEYSFLLQDYDIMTREKHLDILVYSPKLNWQIREKIQTVPPVGSKYLEDYCDFIEKYGFGLHLIPVPKRKFTYETMLKYSKFIEHDGIKIRITTIEGSLHDAIATLSSYEKHQFGERYERWKRYFLEIKKQAEEKNEMAVVRECKYILKKFYG